MHGRHRARVYGRTTGKPNLIWEKFQKEFGDRTEICRDSQPNLPRTPYIRGITRSDAYRLARN